MNRQKKYYQENREKVLKKQQEYRDKNKDKIKEKSKKYYSENKEIIREKAKEKYISIPRLKSKIDFKIKRRAKHKAQYHIPLKDNCEICKSTKNLQRHHWNYDKPLMVNTLCKKCHNIQHVKNFYSSKFGGGI